MAKRAKAKIKTSNVFLDTEVFVEASFNYDSARLVSLIDLAKTQRVRVFVTDLVIREMKANMKDAVKQAIAILRPAPILRSSSLPEVKALFNKVDVDEVEKDLVIQLEAFIKKGNITVLSVKSELLSQVLDSYFERLPPFGVGKNKAEFPDSLNLETLRDWCSSRNQKMAVVTRDQGIKAACASDGGFYHFEDLPKFLDEVASENKALSGFIRKMIRRHEDEILDKAKNVFPNLGFYLEDEDGDVDAVAVTDIEYDGKIEIISLTTQNAVVEVPATITFDAQVAYKDPNTGVWDSEDKVLLFQETKDESVTSTVHRSVAIEMTFQPLRPSSVQIRRVWFEGEQDISVELDDGWPYK
jgi:rRNA-processing protein FCF1